MIDCTPIREILRPEQCNRSPECWVATARTVRKAGSQALCKGCKANVYREADPAKERAADEMRRRLLLASSPQ